MAKAEQVKAKSIAIPSLATGKYGFAKDVAAKVMVQKTFEYELLGLWNNS